MDSKYNTMKSIARRAAYVIMDLNAKISELRAQLDEANKEIARLATSTALVQLSADSGIDVTTADSFFKKYPYVMSLPGRGVHIKSIYNRYALVCRLLRQDPIFETDFAREFMRDAAAAGLVVEKTFVRGIVIPNARL